MFRILSLLALASLSALAQTKSDAVSTKPYQSSTNRAAENLVAIKLPKEPLPLEEDSVHVDQFSFVVYGDTRGRSDGKELQLVHSRVVDAILVDIRKLSTTPYPVRFVLHNGDAVIDGRDPKRWNATFVSLINRITSEARVPFLLAPGNHDITAAQDLSGGPLRAASLTNYLQAAAQLIQPDGVERRAEGYPCYAFGYGNSFFIALDSNLAFDGTQLAWATQQLETLDRKRYTNVFAIFHHPPYSSGPRGGANIEAPTASLRANYMPLFRKHHVNAIFASHEHFFEHWVERYEDAATNEFRMDILITGGGGSPLYGYRSEPKLSDYIASDKPAYISIEHLVRPNPKPADNPYHYLIVRVDGPLVMFEVVGVDWPSGFRPYQTNQYFVEQP
jgi:hypothetical protein